jgi:glutamate-5-semialdehyde dehydrogenase
MSELERYAVDLATGAREASLVLMQQSGRQRDAAIRDAADRIEQSVATVLDANSKDLEAAADLPAATVGRLKLDERKVAKIAQALRQIADQPDPLGRTLHGEVRPNGLRLEKRSVPLGTVLFIYESRPNVTADAAALCLKSGNSVILRGGKEAAHSAKALFEPVREAILEAGLPEHAVQLVDRPDRELVPHLLSRGEQIDVAIPRGGKGLIEAVSKAATMPVLKHLDGNCHLYVHEDLATKPDAWQGVIDLIVDAKTSYPGGGVCNAVEHVLFHQAAADAGLLAKVCEALSAAGVEVRGDAATQALVQPARAINDAEWAEEYLALIVGIKVVDSLEAAVNHINTYGSRHTDGILTHDVRAADAFVAGVDSATVAVNASTRFADGGEYGLGAEIGISTDKLHARGPMGAADLCSYKWVLVGDGHVRG